MNEHPNTQTLRSAYEAVARGDMESLLSVLAALLGGSLPRVLPPMNLRPSAPDPSGNDTSAERYGRSTRSLS